MKILLSLLVGVIILVGLSARLQQKHLVGAVQPTYYAEVKNGTVERVIVASQTFVDSGAVGDPKDWIQTSESGLRKNYAGRGYTYDKVRDAFIPPKPSADAIFDETTARWKVPTVIQSVTVSATST